MSSGCSAVAWHCGNSCAPHRLLCSLWTFSCACTRGPSLADVPPASGARRYWFFPGIQLEGDCWSIPANWARCRRALISCSSAFHFLSPSPVIWLSLGNLFCWVTGDSEWQPQPQPAASMALSAGKMGQKSVLGASCRSCCDPVRMVTHLCFHLRLPGLAVNRSGRSLLILQNLFLDSAARLNPEALLPLPHTALAAPFGASQRLQPLG